MRIGGSDCEQILGMAVGKVIIVLLLDLAAKVDNRAIRLLVKDFIIVSCFYCECKYIMLFVGFIAFV